MSQWVLPEYYDAYYSFVDGKPSEDVDSNPKETIYCLVFISTIGFTHGVKKPELRWLKQYKESESLKESRDIAQKLLDEIKSGQFPDLYVWVLATSYAGIDRNGMAFLQGMEKEIESLSLSPDKVTFGTKSLTLSQAKALVWYNFSLCVMAPRLVDKVNRYGLKKGIFVVDRLGGNDKTVMDFMELVSNQSSMHKLWLRASEGHTTKPEGIGFFYINRKGDDGKVTGPNATMQFCLTDWMTQAAYSFKNPGGTRDSGFESDLVQLVHYLGKNNYLEIIELKGDIDWFSS